MTEQTRCCPACESADVSYRTTKDPDFRCHNPDCNHEFDECAIRTRERGYTATSDLTAKLANADPDDVGAT
jgi:hypothetical protein